MFDFLERFFSATQAVVVLDAKDPKDYTKTRNSGEWGYEKYCKNCKASGATHAEIMGDVCSKCGAMGHFLHMETRTYRKIYNGEKWVIQYNYGKNKIEIEEKYI